MTAERTATGTDYRWIFDTGGSGRGAWSGGFGYRLARIARAGGFYPAALLGSSIGAYNSLDLATGDPEVLWRSWSNWARTVPVMVATGPRERGLPPAADFRRTVKESIAFTLDPPTMEKLFTSSVRLAVITSEVVLDGHRKVGRGALWRMFLQTVTRNSRRKYIPRHIRYRPVVFVKGVRPEGADPTAAPGRDNGLDLFAPPAGGDPAPPPTEPATVLPLTRENVREMLLASCLIPKVMGWPLESDGRELVDGGFTLKIPLSFSGWTGGGVLDDMLGAARTLVIVNNPAGLLWKTSMRQSAWNDEPWVREALAAGRLLVARPGRKIGASTISRDPGLTVRTFHQGQEEADRFVRQEDVRRFFRL